MILICLGIEGQNIENIININFRMYYFTNILYKYSLLISSILLIVY